MPVDFQCISQPLWLQLFPAALLVYFLLVRSRLRWWYFLLPLLTSLLLWGPAIRFESRVSLQAIRVDTTASLGFVDPTVLKRTLTELKAAAGLSQTSVIDFYGRPYPNKEAMSPWHRPPRLPGEILVSDVFSGEATGVLRLPAAMPPVGIIAAEIPAQCYRGEDCVFSAKVRMAQPGRLLLDVSSADKVSTAVAAGRSQVKLVYRPRKSGIFAGKLHLSGVEHPLGEFPFLLSVKEALPRGAFVFEAPSLATWQIARYLAENEALEIEAVVPQKFQAKDYDFVIYYSGNIHSGQLPVFRAGSFVKELSRRDIFEDNDNLRRELQLFFAGITRKENAFSGQPAAVGYSICDAPYRIMTASGVALAQRTDANGRLCYDFQDAGIFQMGELRFEVGISLEERLSLDQQSLPLLDISRVVAEAEAASRSDTLISFSLSGRQRHPADIVLLVGYVVFVFYAWYRSS